eukprot:CAMPEP_0173195404 /NCGR_PEP_ID=MMETSP1141-20130122/15034_1 /TAXON_ID=483371 /ORGANISM="non described non described, Strain CCMP2298" /LENGTH=73 /DNA_ID=CAMNT_0014119925 /DNA_START=137 /DNA_END=358 /DNA_ORIENTATION=-
MEKVLLGVVTVGAAGVIAVVHYQQVRDRTEMHKGVLRDKERLAARKRARAESSTSPASPASASVSSISSDGRA